MGLTSGTGVNAGNGAFLVWVSPTRKPERRTKSKAQGLGYGPLPRSGVLDLSHPLAHCVSVEPYNLEASCRLLATWNHL